MARQRDPRRDEAFEIWKDLKGEITNRALGEQLDVPEKTISAWKSRDKWNAVLQNNERSTTKEKRSTSNKDEPPKKRGPTQKKQKNRSGNPNPTPKFPKRNRAAVKHGLFSKYIPQETLELMGMLEEKDPADLIWDQIQIQYAAIIRAQQIMYVEDKNEMIKELKKRKDGMDIKEREYEFQFAWDRQATFMNAQSRAMGEFRSLVKQFIDMTYEDDERRLKLQQMQLGVKKTEVEIENLSGNNENEEASNWVDALKEVADKRRKMKDEQNDSTI
ncbi:terminase [Virgibacillus halodenitrificans]|uniref:phage terminase small subunit n=1 Tax=Virgibacillus halodenitrificans TaxID=1482 RepID=UPI00136DDA02|nr:terminase [Virgibacillus halodenitrificans]